MTDEVEAKVMSAIRAGRDVRIDVEDTQGSADFAVSNQISAQRTANISAGHYVAYIYRDANAQRRDQHDEHGITADQARRLIAAGARWVGRSYHKP